MTQMTVDPIDGDTSLTRGPRHNLNVTLSGESHEKLTRLSRATKLTKAVIIRQLIDYRYTMEIQYVPLCSSGARCHCPTMHPPPQPTPHQTLVPQQPPT